MNGKVLRNLNFIDEYKNMEFFSDLVFRMTTQTFNINEDIIIVKINYY